MIGAVEGFNGQAGGQVPISVEVKNLTKSYKTSKGQVTALDNVSLSVESEEKLVLLGPSGCGKTTLLRCIAGLEYPDAGEISINGTVVFSSEKSISLPPEHRGISMVFQSYALWPHMKVFEIVAYPLANMGLSKTEIRSRVEKALATVGCESYYDRYPSQLSGGQQQRISLARAIVGGRNIILFDEPLSNVDAKVRERLRIELVDMQKKLGFAAVYVTHDQTEASAFADRIAVLGSGKIAQIGAPREIYERPNSHYVADFVGAANVLDASVFEIEGNVVTYHTPLGVLASDVSDLTPAAPGTRQSIVFRPEDLIIADQNATNVFDARVTTIMFMGLYTEIVLDCQGNIFVMRAMRSDGLEEGQTVRVALPPQAVRVFPAATDMREAG